MAERAWRDKAVEVLRELLQERGDLSAERIAAWETLVAREKGRKSPGLLLVEQGYLSREQLRELLREQRERLRRLHAEPSLTETQGAAPPACAPPPGRVNRYEILERIGAGAMGTVYKARDRDLGRVVALKILSPEFVEMAPGRAVAKERFQREARVMAKVSHPNVVPIYDSGEENGIAYLSMAYIKGQTLEAYMRSAEFRLREGLRLLAEAARGVGAAHRAGVVHRDMKPGNVMVDAEKHARVTDFGLARQIDAKSKLTVSGQLVGTVAYLSPEQAAGRSSAIDSRSDVFALGAILHEMLSGKPPFVAGSVVETLQRILHYEPVLPERIRGRTPDLDAVRQKALEKEKPFRYATAQEFAEDLERYLRGEPVRATALSRIRRISRRIRRAKSTWVLAVAGALLCVAGIFLWVQKVREEGLFADSLRSGELALTEGRVEDALVLAGRALQIHPEDLRALDFRQRAEEVRRREDARRKDEREHLEIQVRESREKLLRREAALPFLESGKRILEQIQYPSEQKVLPDLRQKYVDALTAFSQAIERAPDFAEPYYWMGELHWMSSHVPLALEEYEKAIDLGMNHPGPYLGRVRCAMAHVGRRIGHLEWDPNTHRFLGVTFLSWPETAEFARVREQIRSDAKKILDFGTAAEDAAYVKGLLAWLEDRHQEGIQHFSKAIEERKSYADAYSERALLWMNTGNYERAMADVEESLAYRPFVGRNWEQKVLALMLLNRLDAAVEAATEAMNVIRPDAMLLSLRALAHERRGDPAAALEDYGQAIQLDPTSETGYLSRGQLYSDLGKLGHALQDYHKAVELDPESWNALVNRAIVRKDLRDLAGALADIDRAIELLPNHPDGYAYRALFLEENGRAQEAFPWAEKAVRVAAETGHHPLLSRRALAVTYVALEKWDLAEREYDFILKVSPSRSGSLVNRGVCRWKLGNLPGAREDFERAMSVDPTNALAYYNRAGLSLEHGEADSAAKDYEKVIELGPGTALAQEARQRLEQCRQQQGSSSR